MESSVLQNQKNKKITHYNFFKINFEWNKIHTFQEQNFEEVLRNLGFESGTELTAETGHANKAPVHGVFVLAVLVGNSGLFWVGKKVSGIPSLAENKIND